MVNEQGWTPGVQIVSIEWIGEDGRLRGATLVGPAARLVVRCARAAPITATSGGEIDQVPGVWTTNVDDDGNGRDAQRHLDTRRVRSVGPPTPPTF